MARQFTTFSVVDILGHGARSDAYSLQDSSQQPRLSNHAQDEDSTSRAPAAISLRPGTVNQMLPPLPTATAPASTLHYDPQNLPLSPQNDEPEMREQTKRERKGKRPALKRSRVPSDADDDSVKTQTEEGEDDVDVFFHNQPTSNSSRRTSARPLREPLAALSVPPRDLNSAGETPSPPAGTVDIPEGTSATLSKQPQEPLDDEDQPKKKRIRTAYSREQLQSLERHFRKSAYPDNHLVRTISHETSIEIPKVQVWFQNRRAKARKWGQMLSEPSSNSALYRGALPLETTRHPSTQSTRSTTSTTSLTTSPISHPPSSSSSLIQPYLSPSPYQGYYPTPPYPLCTSYPLLPPYPLPYPLYTGVPAMAPSTLTPPGARSPVTDVQH